MQADPSVSPLSGDGDDDGIVVTSPEARYYPRWPLWRRVLLVVATLYIVFAFWAFPVVAIGWWHP